LAGVLQTADTFLASTDHPALWVEIGGGFNRIGGQTDAWMPADRGVLSGSALDIRKDATGSFGMEGKISYLPEVSSWVIWAAARYGRSQRQQAFHTQTTVHRSNFAINYTATSRHTENHMVVDFAVGKDIGLGLLGRSGHALISAGVRIAQFSLDAREFASSNPQYRGNTVYYQSAKEERRTSEMGPAISLDASLPVVANNDTALLFDWGIGGSVLFGRQKVTGRLSSHYNFRTNVYPTETSEFARARSVVIPNVNGFAGISYRLPAVKVAIGYRADVYLGGVDGGLGAENRINHSFYGPFAVVSFGIGG
jgi:hypothetical protein